VGLDTLWTLGPAIEGRVEIGSQIAPPSAIRAGPPPPRKATRP
jgi:hypothetical protein